MNPPAHLVVPCESKRSVTPVEQLFTIDSPFGIVCRAVGAVQPPIGTDTVAFIVLVMAVLMGLTIFVKVDPPALPLAFVGPPGKSQLTVFSTFFFPAPVVFYRAYQNLMKTLRQWAYKVVPHIESHGLPVGKQTLYLANELI